MRTQIECSVSRVVSVRRNFTSMVRNFEMDEILPSDADEKALLDDHEEDQDNDEEMPKVSKNFSQVLTNMSASMFSIEKLFKDGAYYCYCAYVLRIF